LPPGVTLTTVPVGEASTTNASIVAMTFARQDAAGGERVTASARVVNRSAAAVEGATSSSRSMAPRRYPLGVAGACAVGSIEFAPFTIAGKPARITARLSATACRSTMCSTP